MQFLFNSVVDDIHHFAEYDSIDDCILQSTVGPISKRFITKTSPLGATVSWLYSNLFFLKSNSFQTENTTQKVEEIRRLFQELWEYESKFQTSTTLSMRHDLFRALSSGAKSIYGGACDRLFLQKVYKVQKMFLPLEKEVLIFFSIYKPVDLERRYQCPAYPAALEIASELSGIFQHETEAIFATVMQIESVVNCSENRSVQQWVDRINRTVIPIASSEMLSALFSYGTTEKEKWQLAWKLYHTGLEIGTVGLREFYIHDWGNSCIYGGRVFQKQKLFSDATRSFALSWYFPEDREDSGTALISSSYPLFLGLWSVQWANKASFLFPPLELYTVSFTGQDAVVARPDTLFSSSNLWDSHIGQKAILLLLSTLLKNQESIEIDLNMFFLMPTGEIRTIAPMKKNGPFSWEAFQNVVIVITKGDIDKQCWIYDSLNIYQEPDIVHIQKLFRQHGLNLMEVDIQIESQLSSRFSSQKARHELYQYVTTARLIYEDLQIAHSSHSEEKFIDIFLKFCSHNAYIVPKYTPIISTQFSTWFK